MKIIEKNGSVHQLKGANFWLDGYEASWIHEYIKSVNSTGFCMVSNPFRVNIFSTAGLWQRYLNFAHCKMKIDEHWKIQISGDFFFWHVQEISTNQCRFSWGLHVWRFSSSYARLFGGLPKRLLCLNLRILKYLRSSCIIPCKTNPM